MSQRDDQHGIGAWVSAGRRTSTTRQSAAANPFLPPIPQSDEPGLSEEGIDAEPVMMSGPAYPTGAPAPEHPVLAVPERCSVAAVSQVTVQIAGLHGGAGASTVAGLLGAGALDVGVGLGGLADLQVPVLLVTRTHAAGLSLLRRTVGQWASGGLTPVQLLGVVIVDDSPDLSRVLQREVKSLERALRRSWRLRWSEEFRHSPDPPDETTRGLRRFRKSIFAEAQKLAAEAAGNSQSHPHKEISPKEGTAS